MYGKVCGQVLGQLCVDRFRDKCLDTCRDKCWTGERSTGVWAGVGRAVCGQV